MVQFKKPFKALLDTVCVTMKIYERTERGDSWKK